MASNKAIIQTCNLFVLPSQRILSVCLPIPTMVLIGYTLEAYMIECLVIRLPTTLHHLNVDVWLNILDELIGSSIDLGLARSLWSLTTFIQFHEALKLTLESRLKIWQKQQRIVAEYHSDKKGQKIVSLFDDVRDNLAHINSRLNSQGICKNDEIIFRGPFVEVGHGKPVIFSVIDKLSVRRNFGKFIFSPIILNLKCILAIEGLGVSIVPGFMSSWFDWSMQSSLSLSSTTKFLNEECPFPHFLEYLPENNHLLGNLTRLSTQVMIAQYASSSNYGTVYSGFRNLELSNFFQAVHTIRGPRRIANFLSALIIRPGLVDWRDDEFGQEG
jgi:hypothetical protein